jgi:DNA polymerase-3 subunit delta
MPKLEPKIIQRELEQGVVWPVYYIYGQERMKSRELLKRIRTTALGEKPSGLGLSEENFDGADVEAEEIVASALSPSLGGGLRFIVVRDAHLIKNAEAISELFGKPAKAAETLSVCVFMAKDLDARKKISKLLLESAAVVACEEVSENEREAWIGYLSKRRGVSLSAPLVAQMTTLEPWSLDIVDQELEKFSLSSDAESLLVGGGLADTELFMDAFFRRDLKTALSASESFADHPEEALPLLGLLTWNVRQLATQNRKLSPYLLEKLSRWSREWRTAELVSLQEELAEIDFSMKQTPRLPLGLWDTLVIRFCR